MTKKSTAPIKMGQNDDTTTITQAKVWLSKYARKGAQCPCCEQRVQFYKRTLTSTMCYALILIDQHFRTSSEWLHVPQYLTAAGADEAARGGDYAKLKDWGFIEPKPAVREDSSTRTGYWRITDRGKAFVRGEIRVRKTVELYNQKRTRQDADPETVSIQEALGTRFDYAALMTGGQ